MRRGDISNQAGTTIGFRCVDFFVKYRDNNFKDKILNVILGKTRRAEFDERVRWVMEFLYRKTEYNVDLVVEEQDYKSDLKKMLEDAPFNRLVVVKSPAQIAQRLLTNDLSYYVDDSDYRLSLINNRCAMTLNDLGSVVKLKL